jgi:hypothetical protein
MTATLSPIDQELNRAYRTSVATAEFHNLPHVPSLLKFKLAKVEEAAAKVQEIDAVLKEYRDQQDAAVAHHAEATAPLQAELDNPKTSTARRIECRAAVEEANVDLEAAIEPIKKLIAAAESERQHFASIAGARQVIEQAWAHTGSEKQLERVAVLKAIADSLGPVVFGLGKKCEEADARLSVARDRQRKASNPKLYAAEVAEAEKQVNFRQTVFREIRGYQSAAQQEIAAIRKARVAELYQ